MKYLYSTLISIVILSLSYNISAQITISEYYRQNSQTKEESKSVGTVSNGSLEHGKLIDYKGTNYSYFDSTSYLSGRAFIHEPVEQILLRTYKKMETLSPNRYYRIMECSLQNGGKMFPHKTHQNGTSVDFMMPLLQHDLPYYSLDTIGIDHYWLSFDENGKYSEDTTVVIDFEEIARHILQLNEEAKKIDWKIKKVIIKIELKDELFEGTYGKKLKESGIYVVQKLTPIINALHDEHYHIDFVAIE